jgi:chemotaxis protein MotB
MARKPIPEENDSNDRWLLSYADFITLMFALFVVLYAMSSLQDMKFQQLSRSLGSALGSENLNTAITTTTETIAPVTLPALLTPVPPPAIHIIDTLLDEGLPAVTTEKIKLPPEPELITLEPQIIAPTEEAGLTPEDKQHQLQIKRERLEMTNIANHLEHRLSSLVNQGKVRVTQSNWGITVEINASILFAPADATLNPNSIETLQSIAEVLKDQSQLIHVEGHTDDKAINTQQFPSNWELSAARAGSVIRLFINTGIEANRLVAIGYADNKPLAANDTPEGRLRNRRVQLMIMAKSIQDVVPKAEATAP